MNAFLIGNANPFYIYAPRAPIRGGFMKMSLRKKLVIKYKKFFNY